MNECKVWVLKIPTELDKKMLAPIVVDGYDYTSCIETESCYGGMYPESYDIINYYVPNPHGYLIVPYRGKRADDNYGFYEFDTRKDMIAWLKNNLNLSKSILQSNPEYFV